MAPKKELVTVRKFPAWTKTVAEVAQYFEVDLAKGLSPSDVAAKRKVYGYNELDKEDGKPLWKLVLEQFDDPLVKVGDRKAGACWRGHGRLGSIGRSVEVFCTL